MKPFSVRWFVGGASLWASAVLGDVQPADTACASRLVGKADKKVTRVLLIQTYEKCYKGNKVGMVGWVG